MNNQIPLNDALQLALQFMPKSKLESALANQKMRSQRINELLNIAEEIQREALKRSGVKLG